LTKVKWLEMGKWALSMSSSLSIQNSNLSIRGAALVVELKASQISPLCPAPADALAEPRQRQLLRSLPGQVVFFEGDPGNGIYCIKSGVIALERAGMDGVLDV
jgi:CRP-like cAMP-binding protein